MTFEPRWLQYRTVVAIHEMQLAEHGGLNSIRDKGALESAIARPQQLFSYGGNPSLTELAAAYAYGITRNHPFSDANKRTAFLTACTFLAINGCQLNASEVDVVQVMYALASHELSEEDFTRWLEKNTVMTEELPTAITQ